MGEINNPEQSYEIDYIPIVSGSSSKDNLVDLQNMERNIQNIVTL